MSCFLKFFGSLSFNVRSAACWGELSRCANSPGGLQWTAGHRSGGPHQIPDILSHKETIIWWIVGETLNWFVASVDYYMAEILRNHFGKTVTSGNAWADFEKTTRINLLALPHGAMVYTAIQERHKVEHNRSQIDERFVKNMVAKGIDHRYKVGESVEKGHFDVVKTVEAFREFANVLDQEVERVIAPKAASP